MKQSLTQVAQIRSGYQFRGTVNPSRTGNVHVIQIKDFDTKGQLHFDDLTRVQVDDPERYLVQEGDVLFQSRGRQLQATLINKPLHGVIAVSHFFVLTAYHDVVLPGYLSWVLNRSEFQRRISASVQTTSIPWISKNDFDSLKIDIPPLNLQYRIIELTELQSRQRELVGKLQQKREQLVNAICNRLLERPTMINEKRLPNTEQST